ncbi:hypothetical protein BEP19_15675 [Ammoniphilus oxalaticus]|uniref:Uncharacterized protein n=1 Tax=Ammoniphilus oxalaticus TaxID=66863 RepID=A0A419SDB7_9BACL|nr:DUF3102 domain-containing protein [Ammoniphilus oxalaticus]RKD21112.1 hypothetical protein BEP19_15675 [Ammoniphilus oxalaticus]
MSRPQSKYGFGRRLKHVKENDLVHGEWERWCHKELGITPAYANRHIKVFEEFGESNQYTSIGLGQLYQIATMPEEERDKPHVEVSRIIGCPISRYMGSCR